MLAYDLDNVNRCDLVGCAIIVSVGRRRVERKEHQYQERQSQKAAAEVRITPCERPNVLQGKGFSTSSKGSKGSKVKGQRYLAASVVLVPCKWQRCHHRHHRYSRAELFGDNDVLFLVNPFNAELIVCVATCKW